MIRTSIKRLAALVICSLVVGCGDEESGYKKISPATIESVTGSEFKRITLTPEAVQRIDLKTAVVRETQVKNGGEASVVRKVVPYSSLIYDEHGKTWVYANTGERSFERRPVEVDYIDGENVVLTVGPPNETKVATSGAAELYGVEGGIGGDKK